MSLSLKMRVVIRQRARWCLLGAVLAGVFLISNQAAQASSRETKERETKERAAKTACLSGDVAKGVALLAELFVGSNDPTYMFNQGRCYEQNGKYEEAIARFREYQRKSEEAGTQADPTAEKHIAACKAAIHDVATPPMAAPTLPTPAAPAQPVAEPAAGIGLAQRMEGSPNGEPKAELDAPAASHAADGAGLRIGGIAAMSAGVAGLAAGVLWNLKANSIASDLGQSDTAYSRSKASSRSDDVRLSWIGYGVGATGLVGGAILYYLGHRQAQTSSVSIVPTASVDAMGAVLQGAF
jgi:tetratricopeptide (TPR) repeat protein